MQPGNGEDSPAFPKNNKPVQARSLSYMRMYSDIRVCPQLEIDRHPPARSFLKTQVSSSVSTLTFHQQLAGAPAHMNRLSRFTQ